ncbi:MAG TPA: tRNA (adenosine(37)-N6)-threonylcarbamoyltransferase complex dimerization subunit type 1 TsaB [Thermoanaerobaculia bacterium]
MLLLALDTATPQAGVAIGGPDGLRAVFHLVNNGRHGEMLVPAIEFVCRVSRVELKSLTAVAVDVGPGLFTGLRVGVATAKAIAFAHGIPTVAVSSLEILAASARLSARTIVPVIDALSDEVYWASFLAERGVVRQLTPPALSSPADLVSAVGQIGGEVLLVGDGAIRYAELFAGMSRVEVAGGGVQFPSAASLVELATAKAQREEYVSAADLQIQYLRRPYVHSKKE